MKKTGSIRCEIISGVVDEDLYQVSVKDERHMSVLFCVPKSAVTDIRKELDWSKVEKGAPVIVWDNKTDCMKTAMLGFWWGLKDGGYGIVWRIGNIHNCIQDRIWDNALPLD